MDSLTQFVLGAAVGEVVAGKKIGNRAILWGGFAGTIPDLDVFANLFTDEMGALAAHRGFSHSIVFAFLMPLALGWLLNKYYKSGIYRQKLFKFSVAFLWLLLYGVIAWRLNYPSFERGSPNLTLLVITIGIGILLIGAFWTRYLLKDRVIEVMAFKNWYWFFFWTIFTHPLLDCFTTFGTQLFLPFSNYRVSFNAVSVVDPLYTVPFLLCLIIMSIFHRSHSWRRIINWTGIGISSLYLILTVINKTRINKIFERSMSQNSVKHERYMTTPGILNNILWLAIAESDSVYYHGNYSLFDPSTQEIKWVRIPKNHELLEPFQGQRNVKILKWFTNGYYNVINRQDGKMQFNDMRFGYVDESLDPETDFVFNFTLNVKKGKVYPEQAPRDRSVSKDEWTEYWDRVFAR